MNKTGQRSLIHKLTHELKVRGFSFKTGKKYIHIIEKYLNSNQTPKEFLSSFSGNSLQNFTVNYFALKFFFENVLEQEMEEIQLTCHKLKIPTILSRNEVEKMISATNNKTHYALLCVLYYAGLRLSEARWLKWSDIDFEKEIITIRRNGEERVIFLHPKLKQAISELKKNSDYVFISSKGRIFDERTIQQIVSRAAQRAKIHKRVTPSTLRHCFAIHLIENGADTKQVQNLLGHKDSRTIHIYTSIANRNIKSLAKLL